MIDPEAFVCGAHRESSIVRETVEALLAGHRVIPGAFQNIQSEMGLLKPTLPWARHGCHHLVFFAIPGPFGNRWTGYVGLDGALRPVRLEAVCVHPEAPTNSHLRRRLIQRDF